FHRRPFQLTTQGQELYQFICPFFDNLDSMAARLRGGEAQHIRIGASEIVLRDHLPAILQIMGQKYKRLKVTLREGYQPQLESWIGRNELDIAITILSEKLPPGISGLHLFDLPLVLLVPKESSIKSAKDLWSRDRIDEGLISLPTSEPIYKNFQEGLARLGVDWFTSIEVSTVELVQTYVASRQGIGLSVIVPLAKENSNLRALALEGFKPVTFGVMYHNNPVPIVEAFLAAIQQAAAGVKSGFALPKPRKSAAR
ncbi:MAG TPA: substrate-binding domain-containing protein, partial [Candidatus Binatia bacterium]|nr:substrate-binding domain-containing protein [Candidatus Binatia bacterium]